MTKKRPKIAPKGLKYSFIKILTGSDLSSRRLAVMEMKGREAGPVVWLTGCVHGDEVGGMVTIQEVFKKLKSQGLLRGTVYGLPVMNPIGFENVSRHITATAEDINRLFPGRADGTMGERIAERIFSTITDTKPDLVLDLHNDWIDSIPYALIDPSPGTKLKDTYDAVKDFAHQTGLIVINEAEEGEDKEELLKTLSGSLIQAGIPALTLELGPSYIVEDKFVDYGVSAIFNILSNLKMIAPAEVFDYPLPAGFDHKTLRYTHQPRAGKSGVTRFLVKAGDVVKAGDSIAIIYNSFGKKQEILRAPKDAIVLGHADSSVSHPGMELYAFGYKE